MSQEMSSSESSSDQESDSSLQSSEAYDSCSDDSNSSSDDSEECSTDCDGCSNCIVEVSPSNFPHRPCLYWEYSWSNVPLTSSSSLTLSPGFIKLPQHIKAIRLGVSSLALIPRKKVYVYCYLNHLEKQMGWTIKAVTCLYEPDKFVELKTCDWEDGRGGKLLVATIACPPEDEKLVTLKFRFYLGKSTCPYTCQLRDMRLGAQLWEAAVKQHMTDVEFLVGDRSFPAHKFLLAARSPVFSVMFGTDMVESRTGRVKVDDVDPDIFHQFLRFLYTGQLDEPASEKLGIIADKYNVETLTAICRDSSLAFGVNAEELFASVRSAKAVDKKFLKFLDPDERMAANFWNSADVSISEDPLCWPAVCEERGHSLMTSMFIRSGFNMISSITEPHYFEGSVLVSDQICLFGRQPDRDAFRIDEAFCSSKRYNTKDDFHRSFTRMKPLNNPPGSSDAKPALQKFTAGLHPLDLPQIVDKLSVPVEFQICQTPSIPEFRYAFRDWYLSENLWSSSVNKEWTDVDFQVGGKTFSAHRALLAARCPALVPPGSNDSSAPVRIDRLKASAFKKLLHFLYTGELKTFLPSEALYEAALIYEVDLIKRLFEMRNPKEVADDSSSDRSME